MGGRGASADIGTLGGGGQLDITVINKVDIWTARHNPSNEQYIDEINEGIKKIHDDFGVMNTVEYVNVSDFTGKDAKGTLGAYEEGFYGNSINLNKSFASNPERLDAVYDRGVKEKFHPPRGNVSATQAVAIHEAGHAVAYSIEKRTGISQRTIVERAYRDTHSFGSVERFAGKISKYAKTSYEECIAEAVTDVYCNGNKAHKNSHAIVNILKRLR